MKIPKPLSSVTRWFIKDLRSTITGAFIGAIIGLIMGAILEYPIKQFVSRIAPLPIIDNIAPEIRSIDPNIVVNKEIRADSCYFEIGIYDKYSGIDVRRCRVMFQEINAQIVDSSSYNTEISDSLIKIIFTKKPKSGQYNILITLGDRAGNISQNAFSFVIREKEDLWFRVNCKPIKESDRQKIIDEIVTPYKTFLKDMIGTDDLYALDLYIGNNTYSAFIRNFYFSLDVGFVIYYCENTGSHEAKDIESIFAWEAYNKSFPKGQAFGSQRFFSIGELAPHGMARFSMVCGRSNSRRIEKLPFALSANGNYIFEGYGLRQSYEIHKDVIIEY